MVEKVRKGSEEGSMPKEKADEENLLERKEEHLLGSEKEKEIKW